MKVLKISRKKSLDKIQDTPPATEGELAPSHTRSSGSLVQAQLSCPTNIHPPRIPANLPPSRKRKVLENSRMSKNENAMKTFKFKNVDELDAKSVKSSSYQKEKSQNQDTLSQQPEQPQQKVTESYIQDVFEKIGLAQQAVDRAVNHRSKPKPSALIDHTKERESSSSYSLLQNIAQSAEGAITNSQSERKQS